MRHRDDETKKNYRHSSKIGTHWNLRKFSANYQTNFTFTIYNILSNIIHSMLSLDVEKTILKNLWY